MKKVLFIDSTEEGPDLANALLQAEDVTVEYRKEICEDVEALRSILSRQPSTRSKVAMCDAGVKHPINPTGFDVVFLHASNDCSMDYFNRMLTSVVTVLFSGRIADTWAGDVHTSDRVDKASRDDVREFGADFLYDMKSGVSPPWAAFGGRSAECIEHERDFADTLIKGGTK